MVRPKFRAILSKVLQEMSHIRNFSSKGKRGSITSHYATASPLIGKFDISVDVNNVSLREPVPGLSEAKYLKQTDVKPFDTKLTLLENGLKVATEPHYGMYCTVGVAIDAGSRYEVGYPFGTSHFIEKLAFTGTPSFPSKEDLFRLLERRGALIDCQSTKDTFVYASSCQVDGFSDVIRLIADSVQRPIINSNDIEDARLIIDFENKDMNSKLECEPLLTDWIHAAAYNSNTLGFSRYCPEENIMNINQEHIYTFMKQYYKPNRIVVAGVGVDHDALVSLSRELFDDSKTAWAEDPSLLLEKMPPPDDSLAQYTGGEKLIAKDLSSLALGPTPYPNLAHFVIGFESCGYLDDDFVAFCVLQSLMGGGGSFSAGGPGKGMYTRLYVDVLNRYHWMYNATAYNHAYKESGIFHIQASSDPSRIDETAQVIIEQFLRLPEGADKQELARAKTQLKSQLMMNLEVRPVMFEDLARQVLGHGYRRKPSEYVEKIDRITDKDIKKIAERMLSKRPSVVGYGDIKRVPRYELVDKCVAKRHLGELKSKGFFRF
ncbi:Peptidase M16 inactive domain containing protein [Brugia malayi]|uniref:Alpha-MPP n=2 Tax=Brugia TaxID=6278 RepID=A0A0K0IZK6_BRUMA|nr:Peptidase M16 inactive domain containing protein [Brugia malayi]CRZ22059.1 BMA-MPPA-1 [Brugia malayi]VIO88328.1 Peptidase M16 inactive domain containing protein [Brugia malayi]